MKFERMKRLLFIGMITVSILVTQGVSSAYATVSGLDVQGQIDHTGTYLMSTVTYPTISSIGGEWTILGLGRSGVTIPSSYLDIYYQNVIKQMSESEGNLSSVKYTEYSRLILALTSIGKDVTDVGGYNLLDKLSDYNKIIKQGLNGPVFALLALDSGAYKIPVCEDSSSQVTRERLLAYVLSKEVTDDKGVQGGFALTGNEPDSDITGMVLQALTPYAENPDVSQVIDRAIKVLDNMALYDGGYATYGVETLESIAQVIVAKSGLDIDSSLQIEALMQFVKEDGSFSHTLGGESNLMATEQGFYALVSYDRYQKGFSPLYDMTDVISLGKTDEGISTTKNDNRIHVIVNDAELAFSQEPVIKNGRVLVPMRNIFEALGAEVSWDGDKKQVTGVLDDTTITLVIGQTAARKNGTEVTLDVPAEILNGSTLVPVRFISESLDAKVLWNQETKTVTVTSE